MDVAVKWLHTLHGLNSVLVVLVGLWALALLLARLLRWGKLEPRGALLALVGTLYLQVLLGLLMFGLLAWLGTPAFHGHSGLKHMGGGTLAAVLATLTLWQHRQPTRSWLTPLWCALTLITVGLFG